MLQQTRANPSAFSPRGKWSLMSSAIRPHQTPGTGAPLSDFSSCPWRRTRFSLCPLGLVSAIPRCHGRDRSVCRGKMSAGEMGVRIVTLIASRVSLSLVWQGWQKPVREWSSIACVKSSHKVFIETVADSKKMVKAHGRRGPRLAPDSRCIHPRVINEGARGQSYAVAAGFSE